MTHIIEHSEVLQVLQSRWLFNYIRYRLITLEPKPNVSEEDILHHVIVCLIQTLRAGKEVRYPVAWGKRVAERDIIKHYKLCLRSTAVESETLEFLDNVLRPELSSSFNTDDIEYLNSQISQLKDCDRQLIQWRFFENLSWSQIAVLLSSPTKVVTEQTARQRGKRALDALRSLYINDSAS
jgi:DNA-directed RNA polymerase specialized sigma24 family protein